MNNPKILNSQFFMFRDAYVNTVQSKETATAYIEETLLGYQIKAVEGDGMCILHSFRETLDCIGRDKVNFKA